jgi:hypothetical protein
MAIITEAENQRFDRFLTQVTLPGGNFLAFLSVYIV